MLSIGATLAGPVRGHYFDCYVVIDIYSQYVVGAHVHNTESGPLAVEPDAAGR